jgi:hypothetical protein
LLKQQGFELIPLGTPIGTYVIDLSAEQKKYLQMICVIFMESDENQPP